MHELLNEHLGVYSLAATMAALAVGRIVEQATDWSLSSFVKTLRPCRVITIRGGDQTITADPIPADAQNPLARLRAEVARKEAGVRVRSPPTPP